MAHILQLVLLPFLVFAVIYSLIQFKTNWFSNKSIQCLSKSQLLVFISVFLTKVCICFDHRSDHSLIKVSFGGLSLIYVVLISIILTINTVVSYSIFVSNLLSLVCLLVLTLIEIWICITAIKLVEMCFRRVGNKTDSSSTEIVDFPQTIRGHYNLSKTQIMVIGSSQFSTTYRCDDPICEDVFKIIDVKEYVRYVHGHLTQEEESEKIEKHNRDYKFLTSIKHQNIASIESVDKFRLNGVLDKIVMKTKLAKHSLGTFLASKEGYNGVNRETAQQWFKQIVSALHYLHGRHISHRNIKPENILLFVNDYESYSAKLSDCGLDILFTKSGQIKTDANKYLISAPEYVCGQKITRSQRIPVDPLLADIFNLGVILVLLIKGSVDNFVGIPQDLKTIRETKTTVDAIYVNFSWTNSKNSIKKMFVKKEDKSLIHLLKGMLERKTDNRFDIISVKSHPWLQS